MSPENTASRQYFHMLWYDMYQKSVAQTCQVLQNIVRSYWQVLIFAEKKADVDAIHEYLLLKGVEAVAIHGGKGT